MNFQIRRPPKISWSCNGSELQIVNLHVPSRCQVAGKCGCWTCSMSTAPSNPTRTNSTVLFVSSCCWPQNVLSNWEIEFKYEHLFWGFDLSPTMRICKSSNIFRLKTDRKSYWLEILTYKFSRMHSVHAKGGQIELLSSQKCCLPADASLANEADHQSGL